MISDYFYEFDSLAPDTRWRLDSFSTVDDSVKVEEAAAIDASLKEMKNCLSSIEMELRSVRSDTYRDKLKVCNAKYESFLHDWLVCTSNNTACLPHETHRRAIYAMEKMQRSTDQLTQSKQMAIESEYLGEDIKQNLFRQREQIQRVRHNMGDIQSNLSTSNKTLNNMDTMVNRVTTWWNGNR